VTKSILNQEGWIALFDPRHIQSLFIDSGQDIRASIFFNPINHGSMRLTSAGFYYFKNVLDIESYEFRLTKKITPKVLLQLEKFLQYPYFVANLTKVFVFDEMTAIMLNLHCSNLENYLSDLENHQ